jgi:hypothetical protein
MKLDIQCEATEADAIRYVARKGEEQRDIFFFEESPFARSYFIENGKHETLALRIALRDPSDERVRFVFSQRFSGIDEFTVSVFDPAFLRELPASDASQISFWRRYSEESSGRSLVLPKPSIGSGLPDTGQVPRSDITAYARRKPFDWFCRGYCFDSVCAACRDAVCDFIECFRNLLDAGEIPTDPFSACRNEFDEVQLRCGAYAGGERYVE